MLRRLFFFSLSENYHKIFIYFSFFFFLAAAFLFSHLFHMINVFLDLDIYKGGLCIDTLGRYSDAVETK